MSDPVRCLGFGFVGEDSVLALPEMLNCTLREKLVFPLVLYVYLHHPWFYLVNGQLQWPQPPGESTPPPSPPGVPCADPQSSGIAQTGSTHSWA